MLFSCLCCLSGLGVSFFLFPLFDFQDGNIIQTLRITSEQHPYLHIHFIKSPVWKIHEVKNALPFDCWCKKSQKCVMCSIFLFWQCLRQNSASIFSARISSSSSISPQQWPSINQCLYSVKQGFVFFTRFQKIQWQVIDFDPVDIYSLRH